MDTELSLVQERWLWLVGSMLLALLTSWGIWLLKSSHRTAAWVERWQQWAGASWITQILRLLYAVGIPALALFWRGALTERGLGLQPLPLLDAPIVAESLGAQWREWVTDLGWAMGITLGTGTVFLLSQHMVKSTNQTVGRTKRSFGVALREAIYHQSHWAFYREPFVLLWGAALGAWAGLIPVTLEATLAPAYWEDIHSPHKQQELLLQGFLLVVSAVLYIQTQNLWLALLVDTLLRWLVGSSIPQRGEMAYGE